MKLREICCYLDQAIPLSFQEEYDNTGLQVGLPDTDIRAILITLDVTEAVIEEAISEGCNFILSHHPVIFKGIKSIAGKSFTERIILKAIKNDIAIYSSHTSLDLMPGGVSSRMAEKLALKNVRVLSPLKDRLMKLVTFIPSEHFRRVSEAVFNAGAGVIGNYDRCGFSVPGTGSFRAGEHTNPFKGKKNTLHNEPEIRFETIFWSHQKHRIIDALLSSHPYEEVAYDIYSLENDNINAGLGCVGDLDAPLKIKSFLKLVSDVFGAEGVRYSDFNGMIKKVALCGGSGSALIEDAVACGADAFISGDIKYHLFHEADRRILLIDCGHYETEKFSGEILYELIIKKFPTFAVRFSKKNTNPINYL
jgi:dinuclear metal center YbgI/SA1388 family protein